MESGNSRRHEISHEYVPDENSAVRIENLLLKYSNEKISSIVEKVEEFRTFFRENLNINLEDLASRLANHSGKRSFLVVKQNKYFSVPSQNIAFFYVRDQATQIVCFDGQEFAVNYSLEYIQTHLNEKQFFRLNRQYLINFCAVKEVERYFARKLSVKLSLTAPEKLIVSKERSIAFLHWLDDR